MLQRDNSETWGIGREAIALLKAEAETILRELDAKRDIILVSPVGRQEPHTVADGEMRERLQS